MNDGIYANTSFTFLTTRGSSLIFSPDCMNTSVCPSIEDLDLPLPPRPLMLRPLVVESVEFRRAIGRVFKSTLGITPKDGNIVIRSTLGTKARRDNDFANTCAILASRRSRFTVQIYTIRTLV